MLDFLLLCASTSFTSTISFTSADSAVSGCKNDEIFIKNSIDKIKLKLNTFTLAENNFKD